MSWIQTYTGRKFTPLEPRAEQVDIRDIAHSLAMQCRFNGHCAVFYSVAEHCVRVSGVVGREAAMWGLLHDAAEAYVADIPRPIKQMLPAFGEMEDRVLRVVMEKYGQCWPMPEEVKRADDTLLLTECRDLMGRPPEPWGILGEMLEERIVPVSAAEAERLFLARFIELGGV